MNNSLSYPEHLRFLLDLTSLQLHFAWRWAHEHPGETIQEVLRNRVDLCRKTDPAPADYDIATLDFTRPAWIELEARLSALHAKAESAEAFEAQALECVHPTVETFARKTFGSTVKMMEYQCGSLKYDAPAAATPRQVGFHIGNAIAPVNIFADPAYLPRCLLDLMDQTEAKYGADTLTTCTWLNSLPKWLELFPPEWHARLSPINTNVWWHYGFWGQFVSAKGTLNGKYARHLRESGKFPFYPREGRCSFTALRRHLEQNACRKSIMRVPVLQIRPGVPLIQLWFGNFFEPWLSNRARVTAAMKEIAGMGFNSVNLDSKPWTDFFDRYRGEPASQYVGMQEFMMEQAHALGMGHSFLAIYLNGDNCFPNLRDVPPVRGEEAIGPDGKSLDTYKYWSEMAQASMLEHVAGLLRLYGEGHVRFEGEGPVLPVHTMFDPTLKPSFDVEGRGRYLSWLEKRYGGDIAALNQRYVLEATSFANLAPGDYWLKPEELHYVTCGVPSAADYRDQTPALWRWLDNQTWIAEETETFFETMHRKYRALDPRLFLFPVLAQWGMFFTPPGNRWWDTATRAIDPYRIAPHVDSALFIAAPLNPENDPDAYALATELSIMRNANAGRSWIAGLFVGRHTHGDLYRVVSPAEAIGTAAVHGAAGLHLYGYGGADDGGVLQHLDAGFKESLTAGNRWAARVLPRLAGQRRRQEAAILFPRATQLFEPMLIEEGRQHRMDLLGWYRQLADLGFNVDILHPDQVKAGAVSDYQLLVLPTDACYEFAPDTKLEHALAAWVQAGGVCLHGPGNALAKAALGIREEDVEFDCIEAGDRLLIPDGWATVAYPVAERLAGYHRRGGTAIGQTGLGKGRVLSVGFPYGFAYATKRPPVPHGYHREEAVGVQLLAEHPVVCELCKLRPERWCGGRGGESGWFDRSLVIVNHRNVPINLTPLLAVAGEADWQYQVGGEVLLPHSAVVISLTYGRFHQT